MSDGELIKKIEGAISIQKELSGGEVDSMCFNLVILKEKIEIKNGISY